MTPTERDAVISMADVRFRRSGLEILGPVNWRVEAGQRWVVMGPNGSAKTTLVRIAALMEHPSSGRLAVLGESLGRCDVRELRGRIGFLCPAVIGTARPGLTAHEFVMAARRGALDIWWHRYDSADVEAADEAIAAAGMQHRRDAPLSTLSSGESQRIQLARALIGRPPLLILDEPSAGLDIAGREALVDLVDRVLGDDVTLVLVTHYPEEIPRTTTHALVLRDGVPIASGPVDDALGSESLSEAFGLALRVRRDDRRWSASADHRS